MFISTKENFLIVENNNRIHSFEPLKPNIVNVVNNKNENINFMGLELSNKTTFKASDEHTYSINEEINRRTNYVIEHTFERKENINWFKKIVDWLTNKTNKILEQAKVEHVENDAGKSFKRRAKIKIRINV